MNFLDDTHDSNDEVLNCSYEIKDLSRAFYMTGNHQLGKELNDLSVRLFEAQEKNRKAVGQEIFDRSNASQQASENMISACLAGMSITSPKAL